MNKLGLVVLNYNDFNTTIELIEKVKKYSIFYKIIIVDGCSKNDSYEKLKVYENNKIKVIKTKINGGYGYGNNRGILLAKKYGCNYALIANPDVFFEENTIAKCLKIISENNDCVSIAPNKIGGNGYKFSNSCLDVTYSSMLLNKIFKPRYYKKNYFKNKEYAYVDALSGSLVLYNIDKFIECGMFDENIFLYHEEVAIGQRIKKNKYKNILLLDSFFTHRTSITVNKEYESKIELKKIVLKSHRYYVKNYYKHHAIALLLFDILRPFYIAETYIWEKLNKGNYETEC